jgi:hypothetical protein
MRKNDEGEVKSMPKDDKPQVTNPEPEEDIDLSAPLKKGIDPKTLEVREQGTGDNNK